MIYLIFNIPYNKKMDVNLKINDIPVLGSIKYQNIIYYITINKDIYVHKDNNYIKITDVSITKNVLKYISPRSLDLKK